MEQVYLLRKKELVDILDQYSSFVRGIIHDSGKSNTLIDHLYRAFDQSRNEATVLHPTYLLEPSDNR